MGPTRLVNRQGFHLLISNLALRLLQTLQAIVFPTINDTIVVEFQEFRKEEFR